jgi:hypothetical protein
MLTYQVACFYVCFLFCVLLSFCNVLCIVSPHVHSCLFSIYEQFYRPLPPGGNPFAVNKYIISKKTIKNRIKLVYIKVHGVVGVGYVLQKHVGSYDVSRPNGGTAV